MYTPVIIFMISQTLSLMGVAIGFYVTVKVRLKELEMRMIGLEKRMKDVEQQDDKIFNKLDAINDRIGEVMVKLEQKANRN